MKLSALLAPLLDAKADHDTIRRFVLAFETEQGDRLAEAQASIEAGKEKGRARYHKWKETHSTNVSQREPTLANGSQRPVHVEEINSTQKIEPQVRKEPREARFSLAVEFDTAFWPAYPNKTGKPKARDAFDKARHKGASLDAILDGLKRYVASKPVDREWLNPATFLNQERWTDEPAAPVARAGPTGRPITAQEILKQRREGFANHDEPAPNGPYLVAAR